MKTIMLVAAAAVAATILFSFGCGTKTVYVPAPTEAPTVEVTQAPRPTVEVTPEPIITPEPDYGWSEAGFYAFMEGCISTSGDNYDYCLCTGTELEARYPDEDEVVRLFEQGALDDEFLEIADLCQ